MLLETFDDRNKVTSRALVVTYSAVPASGGFEVTRRATKAYSYVGLTEAAARRCQAAKEVQYLRSFARIGASGLVEHVRELKTEIAAAHTAGRMWSVEISVNEQDVRKLSAADAVSGSAIAQFFAEDVKDSCYDEGLARDGLHLESVAPLPGSGAFALAWRAASAAVEEALLFARFKRTALDDWAGLDVAWRGDGVLHVEGVLNSGFVQLGVGDLRSNVLPVEVA